MGTSHSSTISHPHVTFEAENIVAVKVDNSHQTNCRWYSGSGIYRHTWLLSTNRLHVAHWGTFVTSPSVSRDAATLQIKTTIKNEGKKSASCTLTTNLLDAEGKAIQSAESSQGVAPNGEYEFVQQVKVMNPHFWSVGDAYLYKVRSTVQEQNQVVDEYDTPVGIREAIFDADKGFLLNGERVKLNGVCLHHEAGCVGAAVPERVWQRRLEILQEMGCNAVRTSHNPYASEFLDLCDRMGILVMNEAFDEWKVPKGQIGPNGYSNYFDEWYERDVQNFVRRDRNHPSVILWSAGNEVGDQGAPQGAETLGKLLKVFRAEDPTRPVTVGCDHISSEPVSDAAPPGISRSSRRRRLQLCGPLARPKREILQHRPPGVSAAALHRYGKRVHGRHPRQLSPIVFRRYCGWFPHFAASNEHRRGTAVEVCAYT